MKIKQVLILMDLKYTLGQKLKSFNEIDNFYFFTNILFLNSEFYADLIKNIYFGY